MSDFDERAKARKVANLRGLASYANDTKWTEFFTEIERLKITLQVKPLYQDEAQEKSRVWISCGNYLDSRHGPYLFASIEWVRADAIEAVCDLAQKVGLEYSADVDSVTLYGYK